METIRIEPGSRYWPTGFTALGDSGPASITVQGDQQNLTRQIVVVGGNNDMVLPRLTSDTARIVAEIAKTDVAIAGNIESPIAREAVLSAISQGGAGVLLTRWDFDYDWFEDSDSNSDWSYQHESDGGRSAARKRTEEVIEQVIQGGGTVVCLTPDELHPLGATSSFERNLAAFSTVTLVPEASSGNRAVGLAKAALDLGRPVAVVDPPADRGREYADGRELLESPHATAVMSGRDVIGIVGPPLETSTDVLIRKLDHLEFSGRVAQLREAGRIDSNTVRDLFDMANESVDMNEFQARMHYGGPRMMGPTEFRFLMSTLDTPEGQPPASWEESAAYVRAFGVDRYQSVCRVQTMESHREMQALPALQMS